MKSKEKDFDKWNNLKKSINTKDGIDIYCNQREIWWCSLGLNIGSEEDGKNELFERPILILKVFNKNILRIAPLTSKFKNDEHHTGIKYHDREGSVILSQIKTISSKRLSRKLCRLDKKQFNLVLEKIKQNI